MAREPQASDVPEVTEAVAARIVSELGDRSGGRVLNCLSAAAELIRLAGANKEFRFAESAAYNLREALDSVVRDRRAVEGGLRAALDAWDTYKLVCDPPGADELSARADLASILDGLAQDGKRQAFMARKLVEWFRQQTGVSPLAGEDDPTVQYQRLRDSAQTMLHADAPAVAVRALYNEVIAWFSRLFAPPSGIARRLGALAALPYTIERLSELRSLALNGHHVRLFLQHLADPAWLEPMRQAGLIGLPASGEFWPVAALTTESRRVSDAAVVGVFEQILRELTSLPPEERPSAAFEIARAACWLGQAGFPIVAELVRRFPDDRGVRAFADTASKGLDASNSAQVVIADAVIGHEGRFEGGYLTRQLTSRLLEGLTASNVEERFRLISIKLRRLAGEERYLELDIAALTADSDDRSDTVVDVARQLALSIPHARELGLSTTVMMECVGRVDGELGQRLACHVLAGAADVERSAKVRHLAVRLASETATGDDRALLRDVAPLDVEETELLSAAFGPAPELADSVRIDRDAARAWRWSMLLPAAVLAGWEGAIESVTATHGTPDEASLDRRTPISGTMIGISPISQHDLTALTPLGAASAAARWRPGPEDEWGVSARELARTIETLVSENPREWSQDPVGIARVLREPVYVDHYFRGLKSCATQVVDRANVIVDAITLVTSERWEPAPLGRDNYDFEEDWSQAEVAAVELIDALADANADLSDVLAECWQLALQLATSLPDDAGHSEIYHDRERHDDPLHHAINSPHGRGMQAVMALGGWEFRRTGAVSTQLTTTLTSVLRVDGAVGLQLRSVIAASRPFIEAIAGEWLEENHATMFGDHLGNITFDQTLKYSRPTRLFFERSLEQLLGAARRGAHNGVGWLLVAYLWEVPGYSFGSVVQGLTGSDSALSQVARDIARLSTNVPPEQREITERGVAFWEQMLGEAGRSVPATALAGLGGWALCTNMAGHRWVELTERTLELTRGDFDCAAEAAERCRDLQPNAAGLRVLTLLIGHGEPWEQHQVEQAAVEALRSAAASGLIDASFQRLRERLVQRGRHDAGEVGLSN